MPMLYVTFYVSEVLAFAGEHSLGCSTPLFDSARYILVLHSLVSVLLFNCSFVFVQYLSACIVDPSVPSSSSEFYWSSIVSKLHQRAEPACGSRLVTHCKLCTTCTIVAPPCKRVLICPLWLNFLYSAHQSCDDCISDSQEYVFVWVSEHKA